MIAYSVHLFAEDRILAAKDFQRWWLSHRPNVALTMDEWQAEFEKYLRQGMSIPKQETMSLGAWALLIDKQLRTMGLIQ